VSPTPTQPRSVMPALAAGAIIVLFGANVYWYFQIDGLRADLAETRKSIQSQTGQLANMRDASSVNTAAQMKHIEKLKADLETAREQSRTLSSQAKTESIAHEEQLAKQLKEAQSQLQQQLSTEISGVRQSAETANAKAADLSSDVGNVKTRLDATNANLDKTIADLKSARGDLGVQSGLIATNSSELSALRRLGERNYFEFKIQKSKERVRIADISVQLKNTDPKKNKYTLDVMADDKLTEKKDKNINEPVQFYTSKAKQPYELVVNQVQKNLIVGYLSTPKEQTGR
jgi:chromosome segregation ATPase